MSRDNMDNVPAGDATDPREAAGGIVRSGWKPAPAEVRIEEIVKELHGHARWAQDALQQNALTPVRSALDRMEALNPRDVETVRKGVESVLESFARWTAYSALRLSGEIPLHREEREAAAARWDETDARGLEKNER